MVPETGKLSTKDEMIAYLWKWLPWAVFLLIVLPSPIVFSVLLLTSSAPDVAAFYLALGVLSLGVGGIIAIIVLILLLFLRRRWFKSLRDKLAEDGITANEVAWFRSELTTAERQALSEIQRQNPLLADAYGETLASRLTATRILARARNEQLKVERRLNRARTLSGADAGSLINDLQMDHEQLGHLRGEATSRLAAAKARLQMIEAAASRHMNQKETDIMLRRLAESQNQIPLAIEMIRLEQEAYREVDKQLTLPPAKDL
jgi:hypothetical protein